ncbi:MAG: DUF4372 domain-containing protein [Cytophagales bacterium]
MKHFICWNQLLCMMFGQFSGWDSLRDLLVSISPQKVKFYHLRFWRKYDPIKLATCKRAKRL